MNEYSPERGGVAPDGGLVTSFVSNRGSDNPVALDRARRNLAKALERDRAGQERQAKLAARWEERRRASRESQQASVAQLEDHLHDSLAGWREPPPRIAPRSAGPGVLGVLGRILRDPGVLFGPDEPGVVPRPAERGSIGDQVARAHPMDAGREEVIRRYHGGLLPSEGGRRVDDPGPPVGSVLPRLVPTAPGQDFGQPGYRPQPLVRSPIRRTSGWTPERMAASAKKYRDFKGDVLDRWNALGDAIREPGIFGEEGIRQDPEGAAAADAEIQAIENEIANNPYRRSSREMDERGANLAIPGPVLPTNAQAEYDPDTGFFPRITRGGAPPYQPSTTQQIGREINRMSPAARNRMMDPFGGRSTPAERAAAMSALRNTRPVQYDPDYGKPGIGTRKPSRVPTKNELENLQVRHDEAMGRLLERQEADPEKKRFTKSVPMTQAWHDARAARKEEHGRRKAGRWAITDAKRRGRLLSALVGSGRGGNFLGDANKRMEHEYALAIAKLKYANDPVADDLIRAQIEALEAQTRTLTDPQKQQIGELLRIMDSQWATDASKQAAWDEYVRLTGVPPEKKEPEEETQSGWIPFPGYWTPRGPYPDSTVRPGSPPSPNPGYGLY